MSSRRSPRFAAPTEHAAPDGRRFTVLERDCLCSPCWSARCQCGEWLTKHDFTADEALRGALQVLACADERPGFGHAVCREARA